VQANTGQVAPLDGSLSSAPVNPVDSILAGGSTANVVFAKLAPGMVGLVLLRSRRRGAEVGAD